MGFGGGGAATLRQVPGARFGVSAPRVAPPAQALTLRRSSGLLVDLGRDIGSPDWWRGLVTCTLLCVAAGAMSPSFGSTPGLSPAPFDAEQWEEASALSLGSIADGSTSGRRMAPTDAAQPLLHAPERPSVELRTTVSATGDLRGALLRAGVAPTEAEQVVQMIGGVANVSAIPAGTGLDLRLGRRERPIDPRPIDSLSFRASLSLAVTIDRVGGGLSLTPRPIAIDSTPLRIQGSVGASLYRSARAAGVPARIVEAYIRVLSTQIGVPSGLNASDRFDIVVENRRAATGESESGAMLYAGLQRATSRNIQLMPWTVGGRLQWFEASGVGRESSSGFRMPVNGRMTSPFGYRTHPILRYRRLHAGIDFGAAWGTPVVASAGGQVILAGWNGGYGRTVRISHGSSLVTLYGHLSSLAVTPGQQVAAGQVIGYVGSTGMSTGPHLHYELHRGGQRIDPASFRFVTRAQLSGPSLDAFRARMRTLTALPVGAAASSAPATTLLGRPALPVPTPLSRP